VKTYVDGSGPGEIAPCAITWASGSSLPPAVESIPAAGKSGNDLPAGTGITIVLPGEVAEALTPIDTYKNFPSDDQAALQRELQILRRARPSLGTA